MRNEQWRKIIRTCNKIYSESITLFMFMFTFKEMYDYNLRIEKKF